MMAWVHASIGAALGATVDRLSLPSSSKLAVTAISGVVSHGAADLLPHRDFELPIEIPLLLLFLTFVAFRHGLRSGAMTGALAAISPDFENGLQRIGLLKQTFYPTHTDRPWFIGHGPRVRSVLPQVLLALLCIAIAESRR